MKDKLIGIAFIFIATIIYLSNTVLTVWHAANLNGFDIKLGRMGTADKWIGSAPEIWTFFALGLGAFYMIRAEFREHRSRMVKGHSFAKANTDMHQMKNEELEKDTWEAMTLLKSGKTDEAKAIVDRILKS